MNAPETLPVVANFSSQGMLMDFAKITAMQQLAEVMATATIAVPQHFRNKPGDCLAVIMQAAQWQMNPFAVAQKTHVVNGALGYEAQLVNAVVQSSGAIDGHFSYEYRGDGANIECRVGGVLRGNREITWGEWLSAATVATKNSPLWKTNPKQQLGYLQVKNWARLYAPGAILGVYSTDELAAAPAERDMGPAVVVEDALPAYTDAQIAENLPKWQKPISAGKKTAADIIAMIESKYSITEEQKQQIRNLEKPAEPIDTVGVTFAQVESNLRRAQDLEILALAADLIGEVDNPQHREELTAIYRKRADELSAKE